MIHGTMRRLRRQLAVGGACALLVAGTGYASEPTNSARGDGRGGLAAETGLAPAQHEWQIAQASSGGDRQQYLDQADEGMSEWEKRVAQVKQGAREGTQEAGRQVDNAWTALKGRWADLKAASGEGWERAKTGFERAQNDLERAWKDASF